MPILDLVLQILMAASLISGVVMIVYTVSYRHELKVPERICRYTIGSLLVYSVVVRFLILLPGKFAYLRETSVGFDLFYIAICIFNSVNLFNRMTNGKRS